ncbi:hypothetical protein [[Mycoplasma] anseris]|uniref:Smr domain-containing protein n=1 Tax=[Mycoplasma] anseris TaxID=92400 RepID=A0A2Z4NDT1_9BACT|nr:hypothetical protein [[Mycoplasma] anseris]AWX69754.1 hypothetical protein DP065_01670 [[Mycoplasma] anseris]
MNFNFSENEYDLHGLDENQATAVVLNAIYELENDYYMNYFDLLIGIGTGTLKLVVENLLDEEGYSFVYLNKNCSKMRVYKK